MKTINLISIKHVFKKSTKVALLIFIIMFMNVGANYPALSEDVKNEFNTEEFNNYPMIVRERLHEDLVNEVRNYINYAAPGSKVDAELLVTLCRQYNMDITFVLAQGMLESTLGTKGKAVTTNSVFNVGTFDDGQIRYTYRNANESIEPFLQLVKTDYLGDKKEIKHLVADGGYKNLNGQRYATYKFYESRLRTVMVQINLHSSINMYQDVINLSDEKILAYFAPIKY